MIKKLFLISLILMLFNFTVKAQNIECIDNLISIPLAGYKAGNIQWQFSTDQTNWIDIENQSVASLSYPIQETGYFRAEIIDHACTYYSDTLFIQAFPYPTVANAGPDQSYDDETLSATLSGNIPEAGYGEGCWSIVSGEGGSFVDSTDVGTVFSGNHCTDYTLRWTVATPCSTSSDDVLISFNQVPTLANAGPDQSYDDGNTSVTLAGNVPEAGHGTGYWSVLSGEGGSFVDSTDAGTTFSGQHCTDYTLRWTITTPCDSTFDDVVIGFHQLPTVADAGPDQSYDDGTLSVTLAANAPKEGHGTGKWSILSGEGGSFVDSTDAGTVFNGQLFEIYKLRWTIFTNCDSSYDNLVVVFDDSIVDIDGNTYKTVRIGNQIWMAENLKVTHYPDGAAIPYVTDKTTWGNLADNNTDDAYCYYNNNNSSEYGALYTYATAMNACPTGWHLPSDEEWNELVNFLADNGYNYDGSIGGGRDKIAKAMATASGWYSVSETGAVGNSDYPDKRNASGFSGLPGGSRYPIGIFDNADFYGFWWSSTESNSSNAYSRILIYLMPQVHRSYVEKSHGLSVRCVRDD